MIKKNTNRYSINQTLSWSGEGVHLGQLCTVTLTPAGSMHGIKIRRSDQPEGQYIPLNIRSIVNTERSTDIGKGDISIKTVEHLLSAIRLAGITDVTIEVDGHEIPILDGSAALFYDQLVDHRISIDGDVSYWSPNETIEFTDEHSGASYTIIPDDQVSIEVMLDYDLEIPCKLHSRYTESDDARDWAGARTFVMSSELQTLTQRGLIKGGSFDNALVIPDQKDAGGSVKAALESIHHKGIEQIMSTFATGPKLHTSDELARHKTIDLIGDLTLMDLPIKAKIIARRPGHTGNAALIKHLRPLLQKEQKVGGYINYDPQKDPIYDRVAVQSMLPHRYPFALVDKIIEQSETHVVGVKNITFNEALFQGHFPDNPVFPGVLQMEALAQTGGILVLSTKENPSDWDTYFLKMDNVKFKRKVVPGDTLILKMELASPVRRGIVHMYGTAFVGNEVVSEGELTAQIVDRTKL